MAFEDMLRNVAGVLGQTFAPEQAMRMRQMRMNQAQQIQQGIANGTIDPNQGNQALRQLGAVPVQPSVAAQVQQQALQQGQEMQAQIQPILQDQNLTPEQKAFKVAQTRAAFGDQNAAQFLQRAGSQSRQVSLPGNKVQDQQFSPSTGQWENVGAPYSRFAKLVEPQGTAAPVDPALADSRAAQYIAGESLSTVVPGYGKLAAEERGKVQLAAVKQLSDQYGMTPPEAGKFLANAQRNYKAGQAGLTQSTKDIQAIIPFKKMLDQNVDIAIQLADKAIATNSQWANKNINWLKTNATDNPNVAEYLGQMRIVQTESARVLNNPRLVGQLTDSARQEMEGIVNGTMPLGAVTRVLQRLKNDGDRRVNLMLDINEQMGGNAKQMFGQEPPAAVPGSPAQPTTQGGWSAKIVQ